VIVAVVGLTALSEIGVNVAPLLAGAGIVGIAIGFGSQKTGAGPHYRAVSALGKYRSGR